MTIDLNWLLSQDDWIAYQVKTDLLSETMNEKEDIDKRNDILSDTLFKQIISDLESWPGGVLKRHNDSKQLIHKLAFLADVGIKHTDNPLPSIAEKIKATALDDGIYPVLTNIPTNFGGTGKDDLLWMLCDAPTILYALAKMGLDTDSDILAATRYLTSLQDENGWRCKASSKLGKFSGPGRKSNPCPYANLLMLKLISVLNTDEFDAAASKGLEVILSLWENQGARKERMFGIGTDFRKPKAPLIWFDIIHVLDTLSNYKQIHSDKRFIEMLDELEKQMDNNGKLTAKSMYRPWKEWEFSNKKEPSRWLTFLTYRILKRVNRLQVP
jgi:hypothetical protein